MSLCEYAPLKVHFPKIPVLSCRDYWLITMVSSNFIGSATDEIYPMGLLDTHTFLKVHPFESEFSQNPRVIVQRLLAHHKGL